MKAVIPAAGLGTRFLPATKCTPKELLPVYNKPVIQYVVEEALEPSAVDEVIIVNSHNKPQIERYFSRDLALEEHLESHHKMELAEAIRETATLPVSFTYQDDPKGLGHAIYCAREALKEDEPFFVLLGDYFVPAKTMCTEMARVSEAHGGASVIAVAPIPHEEVSRYGVIAGEVVESLDGTKKAQNEPGCVLKLSGMVEKPSPDEAPSDLFIVGRYLLDPEIIHLLKDQETGAGGEIQLTDAMIRLLERKDMYALVTDVAEGCDTGTPEAWVATNARIVLQHPELKKGFYEAFGAEGEL